MKRFSIIFVCMFLAFVGCKHSSTTPAGLFVVEGKVLLDGAPLDRGIISFAAAQGTPGAQGKQTTIKDGAYKFAIDQGIKPGEQIVRITSPKEMDRKTKNEATGETDDMDRYSVELIPEIYNKKSELTATVTEKGPNKFDFELDSKKK